MTIVTKKGYNGNNNLKSVDTQIDWTPEQVQEYMNCVDDPIYFIENFVKVVTLDHGLQPMKLYPYQTRFIDALHTNHRLVAMWGRQSGKCVEFNSTISIRNRSTGDAYRLPIGEFHIFTKDKTHDISRFKLPKQH